MRSCALLLLALFVSAQVAPEVEITAEPHHHLSFSNDQVRVFKVEVAPHSDTLMHWHRHDYVFVTLGACEVINAIKGKDPITIKLADGDTRFSPGPFAHMARNLSGQPFRNVTIEILQDEKLRQSAAKWDEDRGMNILQGGTQEILWVHDGIRASLVELQPGGMLPGTEHAGPMLLVALSDIGRLSEGPINHARHAIDQPDVAARSGDPTWIQRAGRSGWFNAGNKPVKFVALEWP